ncbi:unnamed protein product [Lactuca saligna]|uniref:Uncharacterized protein n=1 Tax=Lactuca saligna TaxID=75948 RepID=A0AA36A425_LACSI|nr:unnamed protein product [Lactuca saligna]
MKQKRGETKDVVISTSKTEIEGVHVSPIVVVVEDHDQLHHVEVETQSIHEEDDEDLNDDVEFLKEIDFTGINDDIPTNIELDLDDDEFGPFPGFDSDCFRKVNEDASSAIKTGEDSNVLKILLSSSKPLEISSGQRDVNSKILPRVSTVSTSAPLVVESSQPQTSQSSLERSQSNTSLEVPIVIHAPQNILLIEPHWMKPQSDWLSTLLNTVQPLPLVAKVYLSEKDIQNVLYDAFRDKVNALFQHPHRIEDPPIAPTQSTSVNLPVDPHPPRTTTVVNRFEKEPEGSRARITIKQGKRTIMANKREGLLFMKNSNENHKAKDPMLIVTDLKKRKFGDEFGDRSGIRMWAFDPESGMWVLKRNSGIPEYYKSTHDFNSWTQVDVVEPLRALFHNPSEDPSTTNFKRFLDRQVKENFPKMKTTRALYRKDKDILDPESGEPMKIILWLATKQ